MDTFCSWLRKAINYDRKMFYRIDPSWFCCSLSDELKKSFIALASVVNVVKLSSSLIMAKLQLTGQNLGRVFNSRSGCVHTMMVNCVETKLLNLKLKARAKQVVGSLLSYIALFLVTYEWIKKARVFVRGKLFQSSQMFAGKTRSLP